MTAPSIGRPFQLADFVEALTAQLDNAQDRLALKARLGRPLTFAIKVESGQVYLYWFKARDTNPYTPGPRGVYGTDPFAWAVDRRFPAPADSPASAASAPGS